MPGKLFVICSAATNTYALPSSSPLSVWVSLPPSSAIFPANFLQRLWRTRRRPRCYLIPSISLFSTTHTQGYKLNMLSVCSWSVSSWTRPSSSSSQNALPSFGEGGTPLDPCFSQTRSGWWRHRRGPRRSRSDLASCAACWIPAADKPHPPPGSAGSVYRSGSGRSTGRLHSRQSARSWTSLELQSAKSEGHHY